MGQQFCVRLHGPKSLIGFKLYATSANKCQHCCGSMQTDATCWAQQCWVLLANNVASVCIGLKRYNFKKFEHNTVQRQTAALYFCKNLIYKNIRMINAQNLRTSKNMLWLWKGEKLLFWILQKIREVICFSAMFSHRFDISRIVKCVGLFF